MATEVELKLSLDPVYLAQVAHQPVVTYYAEGCLRHRHLSNTYYDTPHQHLATLGVALRLRYSEGCPTIQTVKTAGEGSGGLHRRGEWEWPVAGDSLDFAVIDAEPEVAELFQDEGLRQALQPLFTTDFQRTTWLLAFPDGTQVELAMDQGEVRTAGTSSPISELELELIAGSPSRLYEVARTLAEYLPLRLENISKAARGYALLTPTAPPASRKAGILGLQQEATVEQAFCAIIQQGMEHLHANSPVVLHGTDPEGIHQMRVATRRLRSALGLFRPLIPALASAEMAEELRWLTGELGPARDWDVLLAETFVPLVTRFPDHQALHALRDRAEQGRVTAYRVAQAAVHSPRYTRLLLATGAWLGRRDWRDQLDSKQLAALDQPIASFAATQLTKRHRKVHRWGRRFEEMSATERHQLRIYCKKLRYAAEFFSELYGETCRSYIRSVSLLQDILGILNDGAVAKELLTQVQPDNNDPAVQLLLGWQGATAEWQLGQFTSAWDGFNSQSHFWE